MAAVSRRDVIAAGAGMVPFFGLAGWAAAQTTGTGREGSMGVDPTMAACLLVKGKRQIEVCRWAMSRSQNNDVKQFAQAEIDEHEHIKKRLQEIGFQFPRPANES